MVYADFSYYQTEYAGQMGQGDFIRLSRRASVYLDTLTFCAVSQYADSDRVRDACCSVAEAILLNENGGGIASESNDGLSITYNAPGKQKTEERRLYEAAALYLTGTGLLYRGV